MSKRSTRGQLLELGGEPRINFLPGEIQERKDARRRRRSLFMLVVLVGIMCGIGYFYSAQFATERQASLEAEQQTTLNLLSQQGQYMEARTLATQLDLVGTAIVHASHHEVFWRALVMDTTSALPSGVTLDQWSVKGLSALEVSQRSTGLFPVESAAQIVLDVTASSLTSLHGAIASLSEQPGVLSVSFVSAILNEEAGTYKSTITVRFSDEIYSGRFSDGWVPGTLSPSQDATPLPEEAPSDESEEANDAEANDAEEGEE